MSGGVQTFASRAEWLAARRLTIGASDAAAILGVSQFKSPLELFYEKRGLADLGVAEIEASRWGLLLEGPIAEAYRAESKRDIRRPEPGTYEMHTHPAMPFLAATLDGTTMVVSPEAVPPPEGCSGPGVLEVKTASQFKVSQWREEPPLGYQVQVQHQLAVTGFSWGAIAVLVGGQTFLWQDVKRNDPFIEILLKRVIAFHEAVLADQPPAADGTEATRELLAKMYPKATGRTVTLPAEAIDEHRKLLHIKAEQKMLETERNRIESQFKVWLEGADVGIVDNENIYQYPERNRKGYTVQPTTFRVLVHKGPKGAPAAEE